MQFLFWVFAIFFIAVVIYKHFFREKAFAYFYAKYLTVPNMAAKKAKKAHFRSLSEVQSSDPQLRKENAIRILEIGAGTGCNLQYYPEGTRLTIVDSNPNFIDEYEKNKNKYRNIHSNEIITARGEDMNMIKSDSFDVVVMTHVMCSIDEVGPLLSEIRRVLVTGGKFYFYEHVQEFDSKHYVRLWLQRLLTWSGIWTFLFVGCRLNKTHHKDLQKANFKKITKRNIHVDETRWIFNIIHAHLVGEATK